MLPNLYTRSLRDNLSTRKFGNSHGRTVLTPTDASTEYIHRKMSPPFSKWPKLGNFSQMLRCIVERSPGATGYGAREVGQVHHAALLHPVPRGHAGQPSKDRYVSWAHLRAGGRPSHRARRLLRTQDDNAHFQVHLYVSSRLFSLVSD